VEKFDAVLAATCDNRLGLSLAPLQQLQFNLPISKGGCGVVRASDVAAASFLGNALSSISTVNALLGREILISEVPGAQSALTQLRAQVSDPSVLPSDVAALPSSPLLAKDGKPKGSQQHILSELVHRANQAKLLASSPTSNREELRLKAVTRPEAGAWLGVLPVKSVGLKIPSTEFSALIRWWLGIPVLAPTCCPEVGCSEQLDPLGDHAVMCPCGPSRISRHNDVNHTWAHELNSAGYLATVEQHVDPDSNRRSADTLVANWEFGFPAAHDWVVTHTLQSAAVTRKKLVADTALKNAEAHKNSYAKERCEAVGVTFIPLAVDTFGGFGELARSALCKVATHARLCRGADFGTTRGRLLQRLQATLMRGVARQLVRRIKHEDEDAEEAE
jgi:hypothetical protein